jgi:SpoVK/Ycf46/Vps4 family AAA+-type ATPase
MNSFGEIFYPNDVIETIDEIVGYDEQKSFLHDFYSALKSIEKMSESDEAIPFGVTLSALLTGPPGTGKTSLCKAFAKKYEIPIYLIYADSLIGSILGKTLSNIRDALTAANNYSQSEGPIIVFFDEIDAIASERSSVYEVGEIKRAVVTLLQRMDTILAGTSPIAFLGATNHQHLLDSAVWRRFCYHITFPFPDELMRRSIMKNFLSKLSGSFINVQVSDSHLDTLASEEITGGFTGADIKRGFQIGILRGFKDKIVTEGILLESLLSAGGTKQHIENEKRMSGRTENESINQTVQTEKNSKNLSRTKKVF